MIGKTTSTRPGAISEGTSAPVPWSAARGTARGRGPPRAASARLGGRQEPAVLAHGDGHDFVAGRVERAGDRARRDPRDLALDGPASEEHGDPRPAHQVTTRTSSTAGRRAEAVENRGGRGRVDGDDRRRARAVAAGEREVGDVDAGLAEDRADAADDAGHVAVAEEDDRPLRPELERKTVDLDDAGVAPDEERRVGAALGRRRP